MSEYNNPVPKNQQPTNEFIELSKSRIFSWPKSKKSFSLILLKLWLGTFILFIIISSGSVYFEANITKYILLSLFCSLSLPFLLCIRLYLGWNHIFKRLSSEQIEYEESGWYDGQIWIKPVNLKEKESLIALLEVKPIINNLIQVLSLILIFALFGILLFQYKYLK